MAKISGPRSVVKKGFLTFVGFIAYKIFEDLDPGETMGYGNDLNIA